MRVLRHSVLIVLDHAIKLHCDLVYTVLVLYVKLEEVYQSKVVNDIHYHFIKFEKFLREECLLIHSILNYFTAGSCLTHLVEELFVNNLVTFGEDVHVRKVDLAHGGY